VLNFLDTTGIAFLFLESMKKITRTTNQLHFSDLNPLRFEDLCVAILHRLTQWKELNHFGRTGKDEGVDIHGVESSEGVEKHWLVQCKRWQRISKKDIENIFFSISFDKVPDKFLLVIACNISKETYNFFKSKCEKLGIKDSEIWSASNLESMLYKDYTDLLFVYFGLNLNKKKADSATKVKHKLRMEKKMMKDFLSHEYIEDSKNWERMQYEPFTKFISQSVYIRSVDDETYPEVIDDDSTLISPWFKTPIFDFYHNGIDLWLNAAMGQKAIIDENGFWELLENYDDPRQNDPKFKCHRVHIIGRVPFTSIVDYKLDGDEYSSEPHIFCKFEHDRTPYEKIYYRRLGYYKDRWYPSEFDMEKQRKL
jgi:hypothetical protein